MNEPRVERSEANVRLVSAVPAPSVGRRDVVSVQSAPTLTDPRPAATLVGSSLLRPKTPLALPEHRSDVSWRSVQAPLFAAVARPTDVRAGALEDCYLIASLSAIAAVRPEWLPEIISEDARGTTARFFDLDSGSPVHVAVARSLPVNDRTRRLVYASWSGGSWGALTEKAYAGYYGGYEQIGRQGVAAYVLRELTGFTTRTYRPTVDGVEATYAAMAAATRERRPVVAETTGRNFSGCGVAAQGVVPNHSYAVLETTTVGGVRWVTLQEPASSAEFRSSAYDSDVAPFDGARVTRGDGVFRMRFDDFARRFPSVVMVTSEPLKRTTGAPRTTAPPTHIQRAGPQATPGPLLCELRP